MRSVARAAGLTPLATLLLAAGCATVRDRPGPEATRSPATVAAASEQAPTTTAPRPGAASPDDAIGPLPPAPAGPTAHADLPVPVALGIAALGLNGAPVVPVGVEPGGGMEIPGPAEVGWYRYGARPGGPGNAVLVAHIAYDGVDGVFRHLDDLEPGDEVVVGLADGAARRFTVTDVARHPKSDLPEDLFARSGDAGLVLVTCGGDFDQRARRYEDNVIARARAAR